MDKILKNQLLCVYLIITKNKNEINCNNAKLHDKMKSNKYHTVGTVPKYNNKIIERKGQNGMTAHLPGLIQALQ